MKSNIPPQPGLIVKTPEGQLGMVVQVGETNYSVQVFTEGQRWIPMKPEERTDMSQWYGAFRGYPPD